MVLSLAVIAAIAVGIVLLVPRPNGVAPVEVDVVSVAAGARAELGFSPAAPTDLPPGWRVTSAGIRHSIDGVTTWHVGYLTPSGGNASIEQAVRPSAQWEIILDSGGLDRPAVTVDGRSWEQRFKDVRHVTALIRRGATHVTMVTSKNGGLDEAVILAHGVPASSL